jgi:hypothetical protein
MCVDSTSRLLTQYRCSFSQHNFAPAADMHMGSQLKQAGCDSSAKPAAAARYENGLALQRVVTEKRMSHLS